MLWTKKRSKSGLKTRAWDIFIKRTITASRPSQTCLLVVGGEEEGWRGGRSEERIWCLGDM